MELSLHRIPHASYVRAKARVEKRKKKGKIKGKGGNSAGVPPLPIPNRAVKPRRADGTGKPGEQVAAPLEREVETDAGPPPLPFYAQYGFAVLSCQMFYMAVRFVW